MPSRGRGGVIVSYIFIGILSVVALLSAFIAATGGDAFWALVIHRRTDVDDMKKRLKPQTTSVSEEDRKNLFVPPGTVIRPYPTVPRRDPARPSELDAPLNEMHRLHNEGDLDGAVLAARRVLAQDRESLEALITIIRAHVWKRTHERLLAEFKKGAGGPPPSAAWHAALGRLYGESGKPKEAVAAFDRARELNPALPGLRQQIGYFYGHFSEPRNIEKMLLELRAEIESSRWPGAYHSLAEWHEREFDDPVGAVKIWEEYFAIYSFVPKLCRHYAYALARAGEREKAAAQVKKCLSLSLDDPAEYNDLGLPLIAAGLWEEARLHFAEGVRLFPSANLALGRRLHANLGHSLVELKRPPEAVAALTAAIDFGSTRGGIEKVEAALAQRLDFKPLRKAYYYRGLARLMVGQNADAANDFNKSIRLEPEPDLDFAFSAYLRETARTAQKKFSPAEVLQIHHGVPPRTAADRIADAGTGFVKWGAFNEGERRLKEALALDPMNGRAHAGMVQLARFRNRLDEAIKAGTSAMAAGVDHPFLFHELGHAYYTKHDTESALAILKRSFAALPQNPGTNVLIARTLESLGRENEALYHWEITGGAADRTHDYLGPHKRKAAAAAAVFCILLIFMRIRALRAPAPVPPKIPAPG